MGWYGLGGVLFAQGTDKNANISNVDRGRLMQSSIDVINKAISLNPNQSLAYLRLGIEYSLIGQNDKAINALTYGLKIVPNDISLNADDKLTVTKRINDLLVKIKKINSKK
jgi:tetratricopeptide (TPR) repeat protein